MSERDDHDEEFELMEPFDIDHGELDGIRPQVVFCLGYECCQLHDLLDTGRAFKRTILSENFERVKAMCQRRGRQFSLDECDQAEWTLLSVEAM